MKLSIVAAIFTASVSFNQVFGSMTNDLKSEKGILFADESLGNPLDPPVEMPECQACEACQGIRKAPTEVSDEKSWNLTQDFINVSDEHGRDLNFC
ncbi:uncharacterized protein MELLADRAFT_124500 [Melampsora larici-populina 98AG31]|uniref:Secreted protein n=1 Tax=Melampsora larici-populina (strain 98AG31 / pathotype 3-4-7) TaxID=747676 RepID=F4RW84_MELLP|nr:uncharacterized protein MELLADRAFT_124500 [Melampsora larici-populina 98AG31]EGG03364.1 secreted protein [Melampsora larici-populina 98AG31]